MPLQPIHTLPRPDRQTDRQWDIQTGRQTNRQTDRLTDRQIDRHTPCYRQKEGQTEKQTDKQARQTDRRNKQKDRQTDKSERYVNDTHDRRAYWLSFATNPAEFWKSCTRQLLCQTPQHAQTCASTACSIWEISMSFWRSLRAEATPWMEPCSEFLVSMIASSTAS